MTTLVVKQNSYTDVDTADTYLFNRLGSDRWSSAIDDEKEKALITASYNLDVYFAPFLSSPFSSTQTLAFPRKSFSYYDSILNEVLTVADDVVPDQIVRATILLANHYVHNASTLFGGEGNTAWTELSLDTLGVKRGDPSTVGNRDVGQIPFEVSQLVRSLTSRGALTGGHQVWWRAN